MSRVFIECDDALAVIKRWDSPQTLFYCDPPYINTCQEYKHKYSIAQYKDLIAALEAAKGSFVLSGYPNNYVPKNWLLVEFKARMSAANGRKRKSLDTERTECLWVVDRSANARPEIKRLFDSCAFDCFGGSTRIKRIWDTK